MPEKVQPVLENFAYRQVALADGHWERQRRDTVELYLAIPNDDLLLPFRKRAGVPSDAKGLLGWYGRDATTFGQKLGAFAKLWRSTGDRRLYEKAQYLADEWGRCADMSDDLCTKNSTYAFDKLLGGFLDMAEYMGYEKGLEYASRLTDGAIATFDTTIDRDGLQDHRMHGQIEWYTLPEQLYRAYQLTGDEKFRRYAQEWDYTYYWDKLNNKDFAIGPRHAYSHVNALSSAARAYEASGNAYYLNAMRNAYDEIVENHTFATGGYGPAECLYPDVEGYLGNSLKDPWDKETQKTYNSFWGGTVTRSDVWGSCEVSCCAWAVLKFCDYMLRFTGEAKYGHWLENMLYNGLGGQIPITPDGKVLYYADYFLNGGNKDVVDNRVDDRGEAFAWQCCTGTFPQDVAEYANALYYRAADGLYVSQYLPSSVTFDAGGTPVTLRNTSRFPEEKRIVFCIEAAKPVEFALRLRVPFWAEGENHFSINGETVKPEMDEKGWAVLSRVWEPEDSLTICYAYQLSFKPVDKANPGIVALRYGPLVLAADEMTVLKGDVQHPGDWIVPVEGKAFHFATKPGHAGAYERVSRTFKPYYTIPAKEWYYLYCRINPLAEEE